MLSWILFSLRGEVVTARKVPEYLIAHSTHLLIGLPLWLLFWLWANRSFAGPGEDERRSALAEVLPLPCCLYNSVGDDDQHRWHHPRLLRRLLDVPTSGNLWTALSFMVTGGVLGGYHALVIRHDMATAPESPRAAGVRRLFFYGVAAIGLGVFVGGVAAWWMS